MVKGVEKSTPLERAGTPEDMAEAAIWLMSAANVTGEIIISDAGTNKRIDVSVLSPYLAAVSETLTNKTLTTPTIGDLTNARGYASSASNNVRSINAGGVINAGGGTYQNVIDYITIPSTGNAIDFGDLLGSFLIPYDYYEINYIFFIFLDFESRIEYKILKENLNGR